MALNKTTNVVNDSQKILSVANNGSQGILPEKKIDICLEALDLMY